MIGDKTRFSLYRRPGAVVFIDDEHDYLDMIGLVMPDEWQVELFLRPQACLAYFEDAMEDWTTDLHVQQQIVDKWHQGTPLVPQLLNYWSNNSSRYGLPRVLVVDYAMPAMNGLALLEKLTEWTGACILLSGRADERIAVEAFNRGLLEQFIPKQTPDIAKRVHENVHRLLEMPNATQDQFWRNTLGSTQQAMLRRPNVVESLRVFTTTNWVESVVLGSPFGILGMDENGELGWLQLEFSASLDELVELASLQPVPARIQNHLSDIRSAKFLTDIELQQSMGMIEFTRIEPAFQVGTPDLLGAFFRLQSLPSNLSRPIGYKAWHASRTPRTIRE